MKHDLYIIKLGGSAITDKDAETSARKEVIQRIAVEISSIKGRKIVVHGAGSFGHPIVKLYKIHQGFKEERQLHGFSQTKIQLLQLNTAVLHALAENKVACSPFMPSAFLQSDNKRIVKAELEPLHHLLELGVTPVLHGDIVYDKTLGFSIVSGDQLVSYLAKHFRPHLVVFGCDVDGIYDDDPNRNPSAHLIPTITLGASSKVLDSIGRSRSPDITGGMAGKLREALDLAKAGIESVILNITRPGHLVKLINGDPVKCTRILPR